MKIAADWLNESGLQRLMAALNGAGFQTLAVGGCVRNALMGRTISDVDLATAALPETVTNTAVSLGFRAIPTGIDHGTVTVLTPHRAYEITTFRRDISTDGRHAVVQFADDVTQDAARRDFTINALYIAADGTVIDPLGGLPDIAACRVRFVGDAGARIREDYLRILRFFRFSAIYGDASIGFDAETLAACADHLDGIDTLSRERVGQEMRKLLAAADPAPALAAMAQTGVLARVLAGADARFIAPLVHLEVGHPRGFIARLALIGGQDVGAGLRLSRAEMAMLETIRGELSSDLTAAALGWRHGLDLAGDIIFARAALMGQGPPQHWHSDIQRGVAAACPVTAADFMPRLTGPDLGRALRDATARWLASDLRAAKADLI
jgi:poly(A) polymerase